MIPTPAAAERKTARRPSRAVAALEPRGLARQDAAAYIGIGITLFDALVETGKFPAPARLNGRLIWDRLALDRALDELFDTPAREPAYHAEDITLMCPAPFGTAPRRARQGRRA